MLTDSSEPSGLDLLKLLIAGKPSGSTVYFKVPTNEIIDVPISQAEAVIAALPTWVLQNTIV